MKIKNLLLLITSVLAVWNFAGMVRFEHIAKNAQAEAQSARIIKLHDGQELQGHGVTLTYHETNGRGAVDGDSHIWRVDVNGNGKKAATVSTDTGSDMAHDTTIIGQR